MNHSHMSGGQGRRNRIRVERPSVQTPEDEQVWLEARRYLRHLPQTPDPNLGRVQEIKDEIRRGTYLTDEVIEETAARLTLRFMRQE